MFFESKSTQISTANQQSVGKKIQSYFKMLFVDAHRPSRLDKMDFHPEVSSRLIRLSQSNEFPHLLIYGPSGVGKKTRILALLRELYGNGVNKVRFEHKNFKPNGTSTKIEITTVSSNYHIEMNPSDVGNKDRY